MSRNGFAVIVPEAQPLPVAEVWDEVRADLADLHLDLRRGAVIRLEVSEDPRALGPPAVHLARRRAVGQRHDVVVRVGGVVEEHRQAGEVVQQDPGRDDDEVGLAEGKVAGVVEQAERQAGARLRHRHDRAHARVHGDRVGARLVHHVFEDLGQDERVGHEVAARVQRNPVLLQQAARPLLRVRRQVALLPRRLDTGPQVRVGVVDQLHLPGFPGARGRLLAAVAPARRAPHAHDALADRVLQGAQAPQPPQQLVVPVDDDVGGTPPRLPVLVHRLAQEAR